MNIDEPNAKQSFVRALIPVLCPTAFALFVIWDLLGDFFKKGRDGHFTLEMVSAMIVFAGVIVSSRNILKMREEIKSLNSRLIAAAEDLAHFRRRNADLGAGFCRAVNAQFEEWGLSEAERQVGLQLIRGLSLKEIAELRSTSERTVRQQAFSLYSKAGISGRAELAAFFLKGLLQESYEVRDERIEKF
jgi:DNA-binding CsgD family transcriptional regulator